MYQWFQGSQSRKVKRCGGSISSSAAVLTILLSLQPLFAQAPSFTQITDGDIVNDIFRSTGSSWIDYDGDGDSDLFVANGNLTAQNNALYRNNGDGTFTTITEGSIVSDGGASIGGCWGDLDNDGDPDLFVTNREGGNNFLYENNGDGSFTAITTGDVVTDGGNSNSTSWVDVDSDGNLDLFVINFNEPRFLYLNNGDGTFTRMESGEIVTDISFSISGGWGDFNNDGAPDLFIANGGSQNDVIYRNDGDLTFTQIDFSEGLSAIGSSWVDYNNDGYLDIFVANFLGQDNILYRNDGPPDYTFTEVTSGDIVNDGGNSVGSAWGDYDNDGDQDLFLGDDGGDNALYLNEGGDNFTRVSDGAPVNDGANTFAVSYADIESDGDLDLFATDRVKVANFLYANDGNGNHWVRITCVGTVSNRSGIGARVRVKATIGTSDVWQTREVTSQHGYNSQNGLALHFGLGDAEQMDSLVIQWPSGIIDIYVDQPADAFYTATEGGDIVSPITQDGPVTLSGYALHQNYPNPFNPATSVEFAIQRAEWVTLTIYDVAGRRVKSLVDGQWAPGSHRVQWDGTNSAGELAATGTYLYRITAGEFTQTRRMLLLR